MPAQRMGTVAELRRGDIERFLDELESWRRRVNLTTIARDAAWERHVLETCTLLDAADLGESASIVDVGAGGGVPGVLAALLRPDLRVTLLEADRRKAGFLVHVCGLLTLKGVVVDCRRAEAAGQDPATRESFDAAISRASAPAPLLCELALPLLRVGGSLHALVADAAEAAADCAALAPGLGAGTVTATAPGVLRVEKARPAAAGSPAPRPRAHPRGGLRRR